MKRLLCLLLAIFLVESAAAQFADDFSDGDLSQNPPWSGDFDRWAITDLDGAPALRSNGLAQADTIYLSTPSAVSYGSWSFTFAHREVNLSTFNGARVFLMADRSDVSGSVRGYYLQMGTNNSNEVRLYRIDGDPSTQRVELERSEELLVEESNTLRFEVTRAQGGAWDVYADGRRILSAEDNTYLFSQHFGVWVKHTATRAQHLYFDEFSVQGDHGPVDDVELDITFAEEQRDTLVEVHFSTLLDPSTVNTSAFSLDDGTHPEQVALTEEQTLARLAFASPVDGLRIQVDGVRDYGGHAPAQDAVDLAFQPREGELLFNEILFNARVDRFDARPDQAEYVELYNQSDRLLSIHNLYWTGPPDKHGEADTLYVGHRARAVTPDGFALIFADPDEATHPAQDSRLAMAFPEIDLSEVALLPQSRATLGLGNSGDRLRLHRADGTVLDDVDYLPDWHHAALNDTRGISLERLDPIEPTNDGNNWTSSVAETGGTPGAPNSIHLAETESPGTPGLSIMPSPFFPEGTGEERIAVIQYTLNSPTNLVRARIFDSYGREVRALEDAQLTGTTGALQWDGLDDAGRRLRVGIYVVHLEALDTSEGTTEAYRAPVVLARPFN